MLRVSAISFLNTVPLLPESPEPQMQIDFATPSECARLLRAGQADVGLIPAIEYARIPDLVVLGDAAIASRGAVRSILLLARCPLEEVRTVAADTSSRTSVALTQIYFQLRFARGVEMRPHPPAPSAMLRECDAALVIGDPALYYAQAPIGGVTALDLGAEWKRLTGHPFVFAFWAARREAASPEVAEAFNRWRDRGLARIDSIIREEAPRRGLPPEIVRAYLTENIHFTLDAACLAGLAEFYRRAQALDLAPACRLDFVRAGAPTAC